MTFPDAAPPPAVLDAYASRIEADLLGNILPFWQRHAPDPVRGGFHGAVGPDLRADPSSLRGALLTSRILWTFSAAYRRYRDAAYLRFADRAFDDLLGRFRDSRHGGFFWAVGPEGRVSHDRKQVYGQAFAIYSLAEYHAASGRAEALEHAVATWRLLKAHARDPVHGGYFEARGRDWSPIADVRLSAIDLNSPKSQNTHLHVMEAYAALLRVWPDRELEAAQSDLVGIMVDRILHAPSASLGLFFTADWKREDDRISYGHDIEAAWLLVDAAKGLDRPALLQRVRREAVRIADATLVRGMDPDGGILKEGTPAGVTDGTKDWWPQSEAVIGFLEAHEISGQPRFLHAALKVWDFIEAKLIDREGGEWHSAVARDGSRAGDANKISFWKCPYHNGRGALEAVPRLRRLSAAPGKPPRAG